MRTNLRATSRPWKRAALLGLVLASGTALADASTATDPRDPWEHANRKIFVFNDTLDHYVLKPVARGYDWITPRPVNNAISRVFSNLGEPWTVVNELLQGKFDKAAGQMWRFMFNSTFGVAGVFDIATPAGVPAEKEDFGQTLAVWGVKSGPYVMLPFLGPSTVRDTGARPADVFGNPQTYVRPDAAAYGMYGLDLVDKRADLLPLEKNIEGDRYLFIRNYYLEQRDFAIADGKVTQDAFLDDDPSDDASDGAAGAVGGAPTP